MLFIVIMSSLTSIAVSLKAYGIGAFTFSMMVGVLMAVLIDKGK